MRALTVVLVAVFAACATERIELFPADAGADAGANAVVDLSTEGARDTLAADDLAAGCVCRLVTCRATADCLATIGPSSSCDSSFTCTGAGSRCVHASDCGADTTRWICAQSASSIVPCGGQ